MWSNGNSFNNGASVFLAAVDDPKVKSLPWMFRQAVPGFDGCGQPLR